MAKNKIYFHGINMDIDQYTGQPLFDAEINGTKFKLTEESLLNCIKNGDIQCYKHSISQKLNIEHYYLGKNASKPKKPKIKKSAELWDNDL